MKKLRKKWLPEVSERVNKFNTSNKIIKLYLSKIRTVFKWQIIFKVEGHLLAIQEEVNDRDWPLSSSGTDGSDAEEELYSSFDWIG